MPLQLLKKYSAPVITLCIVVYGAYIGLTLYNDVYGPLFIEDSTQSTSTKFKIPEKQITEISDQIIERKENNLDTNVKTNPFNTQHSLP